LLFYALRNRLGRGGALIAALLWALSPLAVFVSRLGLGYGLVPTLSLALLACLNLAVTAAADESPLRSPLVWAAIVLGLLLASGSGAYTVLLVALAGALIWRDTSALLLRRLAAQPRTVLLAGLLALGLSATALFSAPAGLAAATDLLGGWLRGLSPSLAGASGYSPFDLLLRLLISEPVLVLFGMGGLVLALARRDSFGAFAGLAAGIALLVPLLGGGRHPADLGLVVLALILLAAPAIAWTLRTIWSSRHDLDFWLLLALSLALLAGAAISLPSFFGAPDAGHKAVYLGVGTGTFLLIVALWVIYGFFGSWQTVGHALPALALIVGTLWGLGQLNGLNYDLDPLRRPAVLLATPGPNWSDLRTELRELSALNGGGAHEAQVDLVLPRDPNDPLSPLLRWELRDYTALRTLAQMPADPAPLVIVALSGPAPAGGQASAAAQGPAGGAYSGAGFDLLEQWRPESLAGFEPWLRWLVYRQAATPPELVRDVLLWANRSATHSGFPQAPAAGDVAPASGQAQ
jgi:hypothetical protein